MVSVPFLPGPKGRARRAPGPRPGRRAGPPVEAGRVDRSPGDGLCLAVAERLGPTVTGGEAQWAEVDLRVALLPYR